MTTRKSEKPYKATAKNLDILLGTEETSISKNVLDIDKIKLPESQPRRFFDPEKMVQLADSIKTHGVLENLLVRPLPGKTKVFELVAGERRFRAAIEAGLTEVPVTIHHLTDDEAIQIALVENLQREDLNPVEETEGILQLLAIKLEVSLDEVSPLLYRIQNELKGKVTDNVVGNSIGTTVEEVFSSLNAMSLESFVQHRLPLLKLPKEILAALNQGKIEYTKALAIARMKNQKIRTRLLNEAIKKSLSIREIREKIRSINGSEKVDKVNVSYKSRLRNISREVEKAKIWEDTRKKKKLDSLIRQIESLIELN